MQVEKVATIFFLGPSKECALRSDRRALKVGDRASRSQPAVCVGKREHQAREEILPGMREDAWAQTATVKSEQAEQRAEHREHHHVAHALVAMRHAEHQG